MSGLKGGVWAVVPVKAFARGKSRLGGVLADATRTAFARGLFDHVATTLKAAPSVRKIVVVTSDSLVAERASHHGLHVVEDPPEPGLARVVDRGRAEAEARGAGATLVCMSDLPHLSVSEIEAVIEALREAAVVVVPDLADAGTNVLATAPAFAMPSCFGNPDSFVRHLGTAARHGLVARTLRLPGLCFDVDGPEDLERLSTHE